MQLETFLNQYWSDFTVPLSPDFDEYFKQSYETPFSFWEELFVLHQKSRRTPIQSVLGQYYDFYHDCIVRHLLSNDVAYSYVEIGETKSLSYKQIHYSVNFHLKKWLGHKLKPGQTVALVMDPGPEFVIALLTVLRLGLTFIFLPPSLLAKNWIQRTISELRPQLVLDSSQIDLKGQDEENLAPLSYGYKTNSLVQLPLALSRKEPLTFVPLDAQTLYLHCLREALVTLNLNENSVWAAPLSCPLQVEPCSTLMTLLAGAKRVHVSDEQLKKEPALLNEQKIQLLSISKELNLLWSRFPAAPNRSLKVTCRSALDEFGIRWNDFYKLNGLEKAAHFKLLMDSSFGGALFHTRPSHETENRKLKPSLGTPWHLQDEEGLKTNSSYGTFVPQLAGQKTGKSLPNLDLLLFPLGTSMGARLELNKLCKEGQTFPIQAVEKIVNSLSFVEFSGVINAKKVAETLVLLVFVDPLESEISEKEKDWREKIRQVIQENLSPAFLPDQIEFYPLIPQMNFFEDETIEIDHAWCEEQYGDGLLENKSKKPIFQILHQLKKAAVDGFLDQKKH